jgi:macrolide transport system ATP-binding/permease protein
MTFIQVKALQKSFGDRDIFKDISFEIRQGEKIGLVGLNGTGKTTLIKIILGTLTSDSGFVILTPPTLKIGYLPQTINNEEYLNEIFIEEAEKLIQTTSKLGLQKFQEWEDNRLQNLSGGEKLKLSLAKIWAVNPGCLILDEPTNHLDLLGLNWLINEINQYHGSAIIISHDRFFLDKTVTKIFEMEDGQIKIFEGNYTSYKAEKQRQHNQQQHDYEKQQRKIELIEQQVATLKQWSDKAHRDAGKSGSKSENSQMGLKEYERVKAKKKDNQIKSKLKRLELELSKHKVEKPKEEVEVNFEFISGNKRGKRILEAKGLSKQFDERTLFEKSHFYVKHGEKIGLLGPNGSGKTTFIKMVLGQENISKGSLWKSESIRIAYLSQDMSDLPMEKNVMEFLELHDRSRQTRARTILANIGMTEHFMTKPISSLSLGEQTRVKLVSMILLDCDVLILDEPTNHLDLPSREQLENTLSSFTGTLIIISHDRYLVEKLCEKLLIIDNKQIRRVEMGLAEYEERKKQNVKPIIKQKEEEIAVLETKIAELLGKISIVPSESEEYQIIDQELLEMMERKRKLKG